MKYTQQYKDHSTRTWQLGHQFFTSSQFLRHSQWKWCEQGIRYIYEPTFSYSMQIEHQGILISSSLCQEMGIVVFYRERMADSFIGVSSFTQLSVLKNLQSLCIVLVKQWTLCVSRNRHFMAYKTIINVLGGGSLEIRNEMVVYMHTISTARMTSWSNRGVFSQKTFILKSMRTIWRQISVPKANFFVKMGTCAQYRIPKSSIIRQTLQLTMRVCCRIVLSTSPRQMMEVNEIQRLVSQIHLSSQFSLCEKQLQKMQLQAVIINTISTNKVASTVRCPTRLLIQSIALRWHCLPQNRTINTRNTSCISSPSAIIAKLAILLPFSWTRAMASSTYRATQMTCTSTRPSVTARVYYRGIVMQYNSKNECSVIVTTCMPMANIPTELKDHHPSQVSFTQGTPKVSHLGLHFAACTSPRSTRNPTAGGLSV